MKKIGSLIFIILTIVMISGCGSNTKVLRCTGMNPGTNMNAYADVKYTFKDDKLVKINVDATFKDIEVQNLSSVWDDMKKQFSSQNPSINEDGYKQSTSSDDKKYEYTVSAEIDYEKITQEVKDKYLDTDLSGKSMEEVKEIVKESGYLTCK